LARKKTGTRGSKSRGLVAGGRSKPWRQKGTGRARAGTSRAPHWTGGGVAFAPGMRSFKVKVNRKARRTALRGVLSNHASDGTLADSQALAVSVGNRNDNAPVLTPFLSDTIVSAMAEGNAWFFDFGATDADGGPVSFSLAGADAASLSIDANGLVQFLVAPDYEAPGSSQGTNSYVFDVIASDGVHGAVLHVTLDVLDVDETLAITSAADPIVLAENSTAVTVVAATDPEGEAPVYAIAGGADAALFAIDASTGALRFLAAPNHEAPADTGADNANRSPPTTAAIRFTLSPLFENPGSPIASEPPPGPAASMLRLVVIAMRETYLPNR